MHPLWYINILLGISFQLLLLWRASNRGLWRRYPLFYAYLIYTAFWSVVLSIPAVQLYPAYGKVYWSSQLSSAVLRFAVAAEVHRHIFPRDSHLRKIAGAVVGSALTVMALVFWFAGPSQGASVVLDSLRKIALLVATWILVVLGLARYYRLRIGRNIWGMAAGLLIFMGSELVHLAAMDLVPELKTTWGYAHPISYVFMLLLWTIALWNYNPNPKIVPLDRITRLTLLSTWNDRWTAVTSIVRRVLKP